jgi:diguanylate cyclase (GGDEF)-like protein
VLSLIALLVLGSTFGVIYYALAGLASRSNQIDDEMTAQAARAALRALDQRVRDINSEYSRADHISNPHQGISVFELRIADLCSSTRLGVNFDMFFLMNENMRNLVGCIDGRRMMQSPTEVLGRALAPIVRDVSATLNRNPLRSGFMLTKFGPAAISIGPAWWSANELGSGTPAILVIGKKVDTESVKRMSRDFSITGLMLVSEAAVNPAAAIREPDGRIIGGLGWSPRRPGNRALSQFLPTVYASFMFLTVAFAGMVAAVWLAFRAVHDSNKKTAHAAVHDPLTGLHNRAALVCMLDSLSCTEGRDAAIIFIDLDGFKEINDFYGHEMGDRLLKGFGAGLASLVGEQGGLVARVGGDEFVVLITGSSVDATAQRLASAAISLSTRPLRIGPHTVKVAASVGVASSNLNEITGEELLRRADIAMYEAKRRGGSSIAVYSQYIDQEMKRRLQMAEDMRNGLKNGEFWVACQPIVDASDLKPVAMEILARWTRADGTMVAPVEFIRVAEEHGLIDDIGKFVLEETCAIGKLHPELSLNVNVSTLQMRSLSFLQLVDSTLMRYSIKPDRLQIEMSESRLVLDGSILISVIEGLKARGIRLILDDFGTGYASIAYLRQFQFDALKLDRSLCAEIGRSVNALTMAQGMILVAKAAGLNIVAEGIENKEQANLLKLAGCTHFQGYLFGPPRPPARASLAKTHLLSALQ